MNWTKIAANGTVAFCTTWLATNTLGLEDKAIMIALFNAIVTGLLAAALEAQIDSGKQSEIACKANNLGMVFP